MNHLPTARDRSISRGMARIIVIKRDERLAIALVHDLQRLEAAEIRENEISESLKTEAA